MTTIRLDARRGRQLQFEADAIQPLVSHSPLLGWMYAVLSVRAASAVIGVVEVGAALALLLAPWWPRLGVLGGLVATGTFLTTLSFLATTPGLLAPGNGGTGFILKDLVLLGAALQRRRHLRARLASLRERLAGLSSGPRPLGSGRGDPVRSGPYRPIKNRPRTVLTY
jgi:uncharacterized membrane protein YkgB